MTALVITLVYWFCLAVLFHTFAGYALLVYLLARFFPRGSVQGVLPTPPPVVTVVLVVHNEARRIVGRLENLFASDYPPDRLSVVIVSDGSTDGTADKIRAFNHPRVRVLEQPQRAGKAHGLNCGVAAAEGDLLVFTDARQSFAPDTIRRLAAHFGDPQIGAVSGALEIAASATGVGGGVEVYWRLERFLRAAESRFDSCIGCTGAVYAMRRRCYQPLPPDTLLDDVVNPMQAALGGWRVIHDETARAFDPQPLEPPQERLRKPRTLAGNFQMLFRYPEWLIPWRNRLWGQLVSHKYLRLMAPPLLVVLLAANLALAGTAFYRWTLWGQGLFYSLAVLGLWFRSLKFAPLSIPAGFLFLNLMTLRGLGYYLWPPNDQGWAPSRLPVGPPSSPPAV